MEVRVPHQGSPPFTAQGTPDPALGPVTLFLLLPDRRAHVIGTQPADGGRWRSPRPPARCRVPTTRTTAARSWGGCPRSAGPHSHVALASHTEETRMPVLRDITFNTPLGGRSGAARRLGGPKNTGSGSAPGFRATLARAETCRSVTRFGPPASSGCHRCSLRHVRQGRIRGPAGSLLLRGAGSGRPSRSGGGTGSGQ